MTRARALTFSQREPCAFELVSELVMQLDHKGGIYAECYHVRVFNNMEKEDITRAAGEAQRFPRDPPRSEMPLITSSPTMSDLPKMGPVIQCARVTAHLNPIARVP